MEAFISYSRKNKAFVETLATAFEKANRQVWVDWEGIPLNAAWWQEIETGIEGANAFIFVITPDSIISKVCTKELNHALKHHKRLIPILHQEVKGDIPPEIAALNWSFFRDSDDFEHAFTTLLASLDTDLDRVRLHTRLINRAVEWDKHQRDASFLLRGNDLTHAQQWLSQSIDKPPEPTQLQMQYLVQSVDSESKNQRLKLAAFGIGLIIAIFLGLFASYQWHSAEQAHNRANLNHIHALTSLSKARLATFDELGALFTSVKAAKEWQKFSWLAKTQTSQEEEANLSEKVYEVLKDAISETQERNRLELHEDKVQTVRFNPNPKGPHYLVSGSSDDTVMVWEPDGKPHLKEALKHGDSVYGVSINSKGHFFATASADNSVRLWDFDGQLLNILEYSVEINDVSISPDGQKIAAASTDKHVILWEKRDEQWHNIQDAKLAHASSVQAVSFSHDGKLLASGSSDRTVKLWQVADWTLKATLTGHKNRLYAVSFSPDDNTLATASADTTLRLWEIDRNQILDGQAPLELTEAFEIPAHTNWVFDVQYSPDGKTLASASANGTVKLWSSDGTLLKKFENPGVRMTSVSFRGDGQWLASAGGDSTIRLYDLDASGAVKILEGHKSGLKDADMSPDGQTIASTGTDGTVRIWDSQTYRLLGTLDTKVSVRDADYVNNNWLAAATYENTIQFWHLQQQPEQRLAGTQVYTIPNTETNGKVKSIAVNSDKNGLAATQSNEIQLWTLKLEGTQVQTEKLGEPLKGHKKPVNAISFSPNGKVLASGSADHTAILWYIDDEGRLSQKRHLDGHDSWVNNLGFSHDSQYLATASSDQTVKLWRVADGELLATTAQNGHKDWVWDVSFAPVQPQDDYLFVSGGADNRVKLWRYSPKQPDNIELVRTLRGHEGWVRSASFSNEGDYIVSASADKTVRVWELKHFSQKSPDSDVNNLLKTGCDLLTNYLENNIKLEESDKLVCQ